MASTPCAVPPLQRRRGASASSLPPLERRRRDLPRELTRALDRALEADPELRGTLPELRDVLVQGLQQDPQPRSPERPTEKRLEEAGWLTLPRLAWLGAALAVCVWQIAAGHPGIAPLVLCATLPLVALVRRPGPHWLAALLAPALGLVDLANAFPALAGQLPRWRSRALLGALGYWWLRLAELPLDGSVASTAHAVLHLLSVTLLLGAVLWALAATILPCVVRGRSAMLDALAAILWAVALVAGWAGIQALDRGLSLAGATLPSPHGVILSAALGALLAVAARALRGPVRTIVA